MLTKQQILEGAEVLGLGASDELGPRFESWKRFGLIGNAVGKAPGSDGVGLWHPIQGALFIAVLNNRRAGVRLTTIANLPVGFWFVGFDGVATEQAQRALYYWLTSRAFGTTTKERGRRPTGKDSLRERAIKAIVDEVAHPEAMIRSKRDLREWLRRLADGTAARHADPPREFVATYAQAVSPGRKTTRETRDDAADLYYRARYQGIAAPQIGTLCLGRRDVQELWEWARRYAAGDIEIGVAPRTRPSWVADPDLLNEVGVGVLSRALKGACELTLSYLGTAMRILAGGPWDKLWMRPPPIYGLSLDQAWGSADAFVEFAHRGIDRIDEFERQVLGSLE